MYCMCSTKGSRNRKFVTKCDELFMYCCIIYTITFSEYYFTTNTITMESVNKLHFVYRSKRNKETPAVQMLQYTAVHRATNTLRSLSSQRQVPDPPSDQCSTTVSRSQTASPSSSLPQTSTLRYV
jgi:hypothetical protein